MKTDPNLTLHESDQAVLSKPLIFNTWLEISSLWMRCDRPGQTFAELSRAKNFALPCWAEVLIMTCRAKPRFFIICRAEEIFGHGLPSWAEILHWQAEPRFWPWHAELSRYFYHDLPSWAKFLAMDCPAELRFCTDELSWYFYHGLPIFCH